MTRSRLVTAGYIGGNRGDGGSTSVPESSDAPLELQLLNHYTVYGV